MSKKLWAVICAWGLALCAHADINWDAYRQLGHINDYAQVLNERERMGLERLLQDLQTQYGVNLNLFTIPSLQNYRIDEMTRYIYQQWDLGRTSGNQSALMVLSREDGTLHLYVGIGLRGVLSNQWVQALANHLQITLETRQFDRAAVEGVTQMVSRVYKKSADLPQRSPRLLGSRAFGGNAQALPIASTVAGVFVVILLGSTLFQAKKSDEFATGNDFERNRTGAFGQKKPRWL